MFLVSLKTLPFNINMVLTWVNERRQVAVNLVMMNRNRRLSPASVFDSDEIDVSGMSLMWVRNGILQLKYIRNGR
jgi:hypothetical protein